MNVSPYAPPKASLETKGENEIAPRLWDPNMAGLWSFIFTPVFGSTLILKNWQSIGDKPRAKTGRVWLIISIIVLIISVLDMKPAIAYLLIWYFAWQKKQTKYIQKRWGNDYPRKSWNIPILIGTGGFVVWSTFLFLLWR